MQVAYSLCVWRLWFVIPWLTHGHTHTDRLVWFYSLHYKLVRRYSLCIFVLLYCLSDVSVAYGPLSQINLRAKDDDRYQL